MNKKFLLISLILGLFLIFAGKSNAQMTGGGYQTQTVPSKSDIQEEQSMQDAGLKIYQNLQNKSITCQNLTSDDYEKLGEYFMGQAAGSAQNHVYWDKGIEQMMGNEGDSQMHIVWGERGSGCLNSAPIPSNTPSFFQGMMGNYSSNSNQNLNSKNLGAKQGGENNMMWGYGAGNAAGWGAGLGVLGFLTWLVVLIDLILLGFWLYKLISKK